MKARILLADDHVVVRTGLREIIARTLDLEVLAEAADGEQALRIARLPGADAMLLDIALPGLGGMQVLAALRAGGNALPVLLYSMHPAAQYAAHARRAGAQGYVSKDAGSEELLLALRRVAGGATAFAKSPRAVQVPTGLGDPFAGLSRREAEVARGLLHGEPLAQIAASLGIGAKSVTTYRRRVLDKVGARSNAELAALAQRVGRL